MPSEMPSGSELKEHFFRALDLGPKERAAYLRGLELEDAGKHRELVALLHGNDRAEAASAAAQEAVEGESPVSRGLELPMLMGNYELLEQIAEGGSSIIYRARQVDLERTVAIKLLRSGLLATGEEVQRFRLEAEVCARLDHPSIVPVHEVGNCEGRHFISMKLIEGSSLDRRVADYKGEPQGAAALVARVCRAVHHGHVHGVLHRDLKPSNILIDSDGVPIVADFGTAKLLDSARIETVSGWILGTPTYMAPEQASASGDVTVATDVYSLGCVLYELLVGRPPLVAKGLVETLRSVQEDMPPPLRALEPDLHRDLEIICHTCLAKEPHRRYGSALALAEDLERWLANEPIHARPTTKTRRLLLAWKRNPLVSSLVAAVAVLAVALVVGAFLASIKLAEEIRGTRVAEAFARMQLRSAYLAEAQALRHGGQAGGRERALDLVGRAAEIRWGRDLLDEGISNLARSDIATRDSWPLQAESPSVLCFDGRFERFFVGHQSGQLEVRSAVDGSTLMELEGNGHPAWRARFSKSGRYLGLVHHGTGGGRRTVVWDLEGPAILLDVPRVPEGHFDLAPDRPALAACWSKGDLLEIDIETLEERILVPLAPDESLRVVRYSPTGTAIAVALTEEGPVRVYSQDGEPMAVLEGHGGLVWTLTWSPDGKRLIAGCNDHRAYVWDMTSSALVATLVGHSAEIVHSAFPRHDVAATYSWDGTTRLWDLSTGETLSSTQERLRESPPTTDLLGLTTSDQLRVGSVVHGTVLRNLHGHRGKDPGCLSLDPTDTVVASGGATEVMLWSLATGERLAHLETESVQDLLFLPDGSLLLGTEEELIRWQVEGGRFQGTGELLRRGPAGSLALSPDGKNIAYLSGRELVVTALNADAGYPIINPAGDLRIASPRGANGLSFSADGALIASGSYRGSGIHVWTTADGAQVAHLSREEPNCRPEFSPDGLWLAHGAHREYRVHSVDTWELAVRIPRGGLDGSMAKVTRYSPDGGLLAGAIGGRGIMLIDPRSGEKLAVLATLGNQLFSQGRFTSDGRHLVVTSESNRVLIWDLLELREQVAEAGLDAGIGPGWTLAPPEHEREDP